MHYKKVLTIGVVALAASFPSLALSLPSEKEQVEPPSTTLAPTVLPVIVSLAPEPIPSPTATAVPRKIIVRAAPVPIAYQEHEDLMAAAGIDESDYGYVEYIVNHEGSWSPCKVNGGAIDCDYYVMDSNGVWSAKNGHNRSYGICQALPGYKMASSGADWQTNISTQLRWCTSYAKARYGGWKNAYEAWTSKHWW